MKAAIGIIGLALAVGVSPALAENAHRRGDSSSSSSGQRHTSSKSSSDRGRSHSSSGRVSGAEARHPRAGSGTAYRHGRHSGRSHRGGYYYSPRYYWDYPYYRSYYWGWYGPAYGRHVYVRHVDDTASLRILVHPVEARVYVDGYYAGVVDDFDGFFQRLEVEPGGHEIALRLDGYRTKRFRLYASPDHTIKLRHEMVRGAGDDVEDLEGELEPREPRSDPRVDDRRYEPAPPRSDARSDGGVVRLDVFPGDASVYVDGEYRGAAQDLRQLSLSPGGHDVELVRPGYEGESHRLEVKPDEAVDLHVEMDRR